MQRSAIRIAAALLLAACAHPAATGAPSAAVQAAAPSQPRELLPDQQVQQVLNRLAFGGRPGDAARVRAMGVDRWIAWQLAPERIDDRSADAVVASYETLSLSSEQMASAYRELQMARRDVMRDAKSAGDTVARREAVREALRDDPQLRDAARKAMRLVPDLQSAKLARAVVSERQLQEVMVDFWENHFSVFSGKGLTRVYLGSYDRDVIRPRALGRFRDLLGAVAHSPAMLFYLDNWQSAADSVHPVLAEARGGRGGVRGRRVPRIRPGATTLPPRVLAQLPPEARRRWESATPEERARLLQQLQQRRPRGLNENYARELMELHTLGVDGGYTQQDVIEVARALTGWSIDPQRGGYVFRPQLHDAGAKVVLGHRLAAGRGEQDGEEVLDILARQPATARYIARKLVVHFVSDTAPQSLVDRAAATFMRTDGDIREVVRTIVTSPEFFSRTAYRAKVKTPFELVASALRATNALADTTPRSAQIVARLGQPIFGRQTPDGWPDHGDAWMNTGAILNRINFGLALAAGRVPGAPAARWTWGDSLRGLDRERQVDGVVRALLGGEVSAVTRQVLVTGKNPMLSQAEPVPDVVADDSSAMMPPSTRARGAAARPARGGAGAGARVLDRPVRLDGLAQIVGLALGAPEFQRR